MYAIEIINLLKIFHSEENTHAKRNKNKRKKKERKTLCNGM